MTPEEMSALEWDAYEAEMAALEMELLDEARIQLAHLEAIAAEPWPTMDDSEIPF